MKRLVMLWTLHFQHLFSDKYQSMIVPWWNSLIIPNNSAAILMSLNKFHKLWTMFFWMTRNIKWMFQHKTQRKRKRREDFLDRSKRLRESLEQWNTVTHKTQRVKERARVSVPPSTLLKSRIIARPLTCFYFSSLSFPFSCSRNSRIRSQNSIQKRTQKGRRPGFFVAKLFFVSHCSILPWPFR